VELRKSRLLTLWELMKAFYPSLFLSLTEVLASLSVGSQIGEAVGPSFGLEEIPPDRKVEYDELLGQWERACLGLQLTTSLVTIRRMRELFARPGCTYGEMRPLADELKGRVRDEMLAKSCWALSLEEAEHYNNWAKGWEKIMMRFPKTTRDIEESRKCFACSRYAATVFHSLHVVEAGLIELGQFIDVKDPKSGWTAVTNRLKKIVSSKHEDRTDFEKRNFEFLEQVHATTEALKNAWRNKIDHTQSSLVLMTPDFSAEIAEEILFASRAFMRRLADGLPDLEEKL